MRPLALNVHGNSHMTMASRLAAQPIRAIDWGTYIEVKVCATPNGRLGFVPRNYLTVDGLSPNH